MTNENNMVQGNENHDLDAPELTDQEVNDMFDEWYENEAETVECYWAYFLEMWAKETLSWLRDGTLKHEFKEYLCENLKDDFYNSVDETVSIDYVSKRVGDI